MATQLDNTWLAQARRREQPLGSLAYADDAGVRSLRVRNVGLLERLRLFGRIVGQYTTAGPTAVDQMGQYCGPYQRVTLRVGSLGAIYDVSGWNAFLITVIDRAHRRQFTTLTHRPYSFTAAPALAAFSNVFPLVIPLGITLRNFDAPLGLIQTAVQGQDVVLEIRHNPIAAAAAANPNTAVYLGNNANLAAATYASSKTDVAYDYFDPIPAEFDRAQPNLSVVHQWLEYQYPITGDGDLEILLNPSNIYTRFVLTIVSGAAGSLTPNNDILTKLRLVYGGSQAPYDLDANTLKQRIADDYANITWPGGVYILDLLEDAMTERDAFNAAAATNPRLILSTTGGTYGAGAHVRLAVEQLVPLVDGRGSYGPQGPQ